MGLVEVHQGEGSYVRSIASEDVGLPEWNALLMNRETVLDLIEARKALETSNAALAAEKRTEDDLRRFESILQRMERHLGDEEEGERSDIEFHLALAEATHNAILVRMIDSISSQMQLAIRETRRLQMYGSRAVSEQLWRDHQTVYEAVKRQDAEEAREAMRRHLFHVERGLVPYLNK